MTAEEYSAIWTETKKAMKYIIKKNLPFVSSAVPSGHGTNLLISYDVADIDKKAITHVKKTYPLALVNFTNDWVIVED